MRKLLAMVLMLGATPALAVPNYAGWNALSRSDKVTYTMGIVDALSVVSTVDAQDRLNDRAIMDACFKNKDMTYDMIADQIESFYQDNIDKWDYPPTVAFMNRVLAKGGVCDRERKEVLGE